MRARNDGESERDYEKHVCTNTNSMYRYITHTHAYCTMYEMFQFILMLGFPTESIYVHCSFL